jgi:hypothetical protein
MPRIGRSPEHMARMRARRRPFSDPRAGRLLSAIEFAFVLSRGEPISTTGLVRSCYPAEHILGGLKSWHRSNVVRPARCVAEPIGRASTRGRPLVWRAMPERIKAGFISWRRTGPPPVWQLVSVFFACFKFQNSLLPGKPLVWLCTARSATRTTSTGAVIVRKCCNGWSSTPKS